MKTIYPVVTEINLSLEEQVELGRRMTLFNDQAAKDKLVLNCVPLVVHVAKSFSHHSQASYDDFFQEGMVGVMEAIERYDYTRNVKFTSFAYSRIIHYLARWSQKQIRYQMPNTRGGSLNSAVVNSTIESFQSLFQRQPTDSQLAKLLSVSEDEIAQYRQQTRNPVPYGYRVSPQEFNRYSASFVTATDVSSVVEDALCKEYNRKIVAEALAQLNDVEREIITERYLYQDKKVTLMELAERQGVNASTVMRRERKALQTLLKILEEKGAVI